MQVSTLAYNSYVGAIAIGRITRGRVRRNMPIMVAKRDGGQHRAKIGLVYGFSGWRGSRLKRRQQEILSRFPGWKRRTCRTPSVILSRSKRLPALLLMNLPSA